MLNRFRNQSFSPVSLRLKIIKTTNETKLNKNEYESKIEFFFCVGCYRGHRVQVLRPCHGVWILLDWLEIARFMGDDWKVYASRHNLIHHKGYISISDAIGTLVTFMSITRWAILEWNRLENGKIDGFKPRCRILKLFANKLPTTLPNAPSHSQHAQKASVHTEDFSRFYLQLSVSVDTNNELSCEKKIN